MLDAARILANLRMPMVVLVLTVRSEVVFFVGDDATVKYWDLGKFWERIDARVF